MTALLPRRECCRLASEVAAGINLGLPESQALVRSHAFMRDLLTRIAAWHGSGRVGMPDELRRELEEATR